MKKNPFHLGFAYLLMGVLLFSTGMLYYFVPQGTVPYSRTLARLAWPQQSIHSPWRLYQAHLQNKICDGGAVYLMPCSVDVVDRFHDAYEKHLQFISTNGKAQQGSMPRIYALKIPSDIRGIKSSTKRRELFIKMVLPLILKTNEHILNQRAHLLAIDYRLRHGLPLTVTDQNFLKVVAQEYKVPTMSLATLLKRVDIVPPSLAIAQTLLESGCGTSCAALTKNSIFGHMQTLTEVAAFPSVMESVYVYVRNLNRNPAYTPFQNLRYEMRQKGKPLCGTTLANGLVKYSELGRAYIEKVQYLIKLYKLEQYDTTKFLSA